MEKRRYVHWLKLTALAPAIDEARQYAEIDGYLNRHPDAHAEIFRYDFVLCDRVVRLECNENWNDLDLAANTNSNYLRRLVRKPQNLCDRKPFAIPRYIGPTVESLSKNDAV